MRLLGHGLLHYCVSKEMGSTSRPATADITSYNWIVSADGPVEDVKTSSSVGSRLLAKPKYRGREVFEQVFDITDPNTPIDLSLEFTIHNTFLRKSEYWGAKVRDPMNFLSLNVKFLAGRPCTGYDIRWESENEVAHQVNKSPTYEEKARSLHWETSSPVYLRSYILSWNW